MIESSVFAAFVNKGQQLSFDESVELYRFSLKKEFFNGQDLEVVKASVIEINSTAKITENGDDFVMEFAAGSGNWCDGFQSYFFSRLSDFWRYCTRIRKCPEQFCILDKKLSEHDSNNKIINKISYVSRWIELLSKMADHHPKDNVFVFFVSQNENKTKSYQINALVDVENILEISFECDESLYEHMIESWNFSDAHEKERQSVMLASFAEIMTKLDEYENPFMFFIKNCKKFYERYRENYDIYVNRFTVETQLREIDEQHLTFVGQLQELITSAQSKAFALPGVMIAIAALAKVDNYIGVLAIVVGAILTKIIVQKSNELLTENISYFKEVTDRALGKYVLSRSENKEVVSHASEAKEKLNIQIENAKKRVNFIDSMSLITMVIAILFAVIILISKVELEINEVWGLVISKFNLIVCYLNLIIN